jgi:hypothetical protein
MGEIEGRTAADPSRFTFVEEVITTEVVEATSQAFRWHRPDG